MSKLTITGKSKREFETDAEKITIRFQIHAESAAAASEKVIAECEAFLEELARWGVPSEQIHISDDDIDQRQMDRKYHDREVDVIAKREITMDLPYDMKFNNSIMALVQEKQMDIVFDISYYLSNYEEIHNELMKEALADSKAKAELIASAMGQRIIGIDTLQTSGVYRNLAKSVCMEQEGGWSYAPADRAPMLSDQLKAPMKEEAESIEVVWIMTI